MQIYIFEAAVVPEHNCKHGLLFLASVYQSAYRKHCARLTNHIVLSLVMIKKWIVTNGWIHLLASASTLDLLLDDFAKRFQECDY